MDFNKIEFLAALNSIRQQTFKPSTIISAFRKTGLIPYNPNKVLATLRENRMPEPSTPSPSPEQPTTVESFKRQGEDILREALDMGLPSPFKKKLKVLLVGGLAQAYAGKVAFEDFENTVAVQNVRTARQKARRHQMRMGKGGLLYQDGARSMKRHKDEEEVRKAQAALSRAQSTMMRAERAARKPFLDEMKAHTREWRTARAERKRIMKALCVEIRKRGRGRRV